MKGPTVASLFAGCGGSSLGYKQAGFRELLAVDWDDNAIKTFRLNFPKVKCMKIDLIKAKGKDLLKIMGIKMGELQVLDGSPPCQGFSTAGKREVSDPRNDLFLHNIRLIKEMFPETFVIENVKGMTLGTMKGLFNDYSRKLRGLGYSVRCKLLNAKYYGVPQSRQRCIWIGIRTDFKKEGPFHPSPITKRPLSINQVLKGVKPKTFEKMSELELKRWHKAHFGKAPGKYNAIRRLDSSMPSSTLMKSTPHYHWSEPRKVSIEEAKRIQGFPDDFIFTGSFDDQWGRIGNSVPPPLMKAIAENLRRIMDW